MKTTCGLLGIVMSLAGGLAAAQQPASNEDAPVCYPEPEPEPEICFPSSRCVWDCGFQECGSLPNGGTCTVSTATCSVEERLDDEMACSRGGHVGRGGGSSEGLLAH